MEIRDILKHKGGTVITVNADDTIHDAVNRLNEHGIGALVVLDDANQIAGIISERDVLRHCARYCMREPEDETAACPTIVRDAMTKNVIIGLPHDNLAFVMGVMTRNRIRHLPVLDGDDLVGIISIGDVVNTFVEETEFENRQLKDYIQGALS